MTMPNLRRRSNELDSYSSGYEVYKLAYDVRGPHHDSTGARLTQNPRSNSIQGLERLGAFGIDATELDHLQHSIDGLSAIVFH